MRQITRDAVAAFNQLREFRRGNTRVARTEVDGFPEMSLYLHGNLIAIETPNGLHITSSGWSSVTTKERLNGLPGVHIQQKDFQWFLNGEHWDGSWITV
jgi:hypothetical protein